MTSQRVVRKSLAGEEDLLFGEGTVTQSRNGQDYDITKVRVIRPVNSLAELNALDPTQFPKAALYSESTVTLYVYNGTSYVALGNSVAIDFTSNILTDTGTPTAYTSGFYDSNKATASGATWIADNTTGPAGTLDLSNGRVYNGVGAGYVISSNKLYLKMFGGVSNITDFLTYTWKMKLPAFIDSGNYDVSSAILNLSDNCAASLICEVGEAVFNYTGTEIENLIIATDVDGAYFRNVTFQCADNINAPLTVQKTTGPAGIVDMYNVKAYDVKQTLLTVNPVGILVSGNYSQVDIINCTVEGVSCVDTARSCTGIGIIQFGGVATVQGNLIRNVVTPDDNDADGLKIFGTDVGTIVTFLGATADVSNNVFEDCQGRWAKFQISDVKFYGNQLKLSTGFTTITNFAGVDFQSNNGNAFDNTIRIGTITFGTTAKLFAFQNIRNDGGAKVSYCKNNRCTSATTVETFAECTTEYGTNTVVIEDNEYAGASVNHWLRHNELNLANTDKINLYLRNNKADGVVVSFYEPLNDIDFGAKLYFEITGNENFNGSYPQIKDSSTVNFACGGNFVMRSNAGFTNRVDWIFDMDDLRKGNSFFTGGQAVTNKSPNVTSFFHVISEDFVQYSIATDGSAEDRRTTTTGTSWNAWVAV